MPEHRGENSTSIASYGRRTLSAPFDMRYQNDPNIGQGVADYIAYLHGTDIQRPTRIRVKTEDPDLLDDILALDIGSRITLTEAQTAVASKECYIHAIEYEISGGNVTRAWLTLAPADTGLYFELDHATKGKLDNVTYLLGYA